MVLSKKRKNGHSDGSYLFCVFLFLRDVSIFFFFFFAHNKCWTLHIKSLILSFESVVKMRFILCGRILDFATLVEDVVTNRYVSS